MTRVEQRSSHSVWACSEDHQDIGECRRPERCGCSCHDLWDKP